MKFLRNGKRCFSPVLQVAYLDMIRSLCKTQESAYFIFNLLASERMKPGKDCSLHTEFIRRIRMSYIEASYYIQRFRLDFSSSHNVIVCRK